MLSLADQHRAEIKDWTGLVVAILFHDYIYNPTEKDNEEKSALAMLDYFGSLVDDSSMLIKAAAGQPTLPAPPFGPDSNGGWFLKERHIPPAGGRKPHIAMILMDGECTLT